MVTIGDVWAVTAALVGMLVTVWALTLALAMLFDGRCERAHEVVKTNPQKALYRGLGYLVGLGILFIMFLNLPLAPLKFAGFLGLLSLAAIAAVGAGGISMLAAARIKELDPTISEYGALSRGVLLIVSSAFVPFLGWMLVLPVLFAASLGAGMSALFGKAQALDLSKPPVMG